MEPIILTNATVVTLDPARPRACGLRIEGARITEVYDGAPPEAAAGERIDLGGAVVLPGLVDAHLHIASLGAAARQLDFRGTRAAEEVVSKVRQAAQRMPAGAWIRGRAWDQNDWPVKQFPSRALLDEAAPGHPVWLTRVDGHAVWLNSAALALAGIDAGTPDPAGGEILRDASGAPTGILVDNAIDLAATRLPAPTAAEIRADIKEALSRCNQVGLTGAHDMGTTPAELAELRALEAAGELTLRITVYLDGQGHDPATQVTEPPDHEGLVRVVGVKMYADGALGSRGAALLAPYSDRADTTGLVLTDPAELAASTTRVHAAGYQAAIHAIGDRGVRMTLDAIEAAQGHERTRRHRVEHAQVVAPGDVDRFASLGVVASMQTTHATSDMPWAEERLGPERVRGAYAWRTLLDSRARLAFGSDAPVEEENPWLGIYAGVTRQDSAGKPERGWLPEQRLSVLETIAGFTTGAAHAGLQDDLGMIRPGAIADLTIVDRDPEAVTPRELLEVQTVGVWLNGRPVWP